jgi:hypothetical protein
MGDTLDSISDQARIAGPIVSGAYTVAQAVARQAAQDFSGWLGAGMNAHVQWARWAFSQNWVRSAAATAPVWRTVSATFSYWGVSTTVTAGGTSTGATVAGLGALGIIGASAVVAAGTWIMMGLGYYEARKWARQQGVLSGFSFGFVAGVSKWEWHHVAGIFAKRRAIATNRFDPAVNVQEALGNNEGLKNGFAFGASLPEEAKKFYRIVLRKLAGRHSAAPWSTNADEAYLQQRDYIIELAGAGRRANLIIAE